MSDRARGTVRAAAALAATLLLAAPATAEADAPAGTDAPALASPARAAATWMAGELTDGTHASGDHGLTADVVLALAATGTGGAAAEKATDWLEDDVASYVERGGPGTVFAGGAAKLALVAAVQGRDPGDLGGLDLTGKLLGRMQSDGRFTDDAPGGDMSNLFTQSLAVLALARTGDLPDRAADFLAGSRCADGGYPLVFRADPARCKSHTDSTGLAVQALLGAGRTADAAPALDWLETQQLDDGSFRDNGFGTPPGNSNSTALDVQALAAGGRTGPAAKGVAWLKSRQVGCTAPAADRGAVGYAEPVADGTALRATAQAVPALAGKSLAEVDGTDAVPGLEDSDCSPPGGGTGGGSGGGGTDSGGADSGGTDSGGADSGGADSGGAGGGTDSGGTDSGGTGTDGGTAGADAGGSTTTGSSGGATDGGSSGAPGPPPDSTGGTGPTGGSAPTPDGDLASTGSPALLLAAAAAAALAAGAAAVALARPRRARY
ncbi:prenyltransferase/squalene oxidase repeat-containing protein [Streptomyces sp. 184]|uniref:prenyltransferase/squalene oxidase repeat-containing protein n=1 Tax=Streptomyces sp. 184 TaxID=1827526 RepID=UPI003891A5AF